MGRHRGAGGDRRALLVLSVAVVALLAVAGVAIATGSSSTAPTGRPRSTAGTVRAGCTTVRVVTDPDNVGWLSIVATDYTKRHREVVGRCVEIAVAGVAPGALPAAIGHGDPGRRPDAWLATSTVEVAAVRAGPATASQLAASGPSVACSPLVAGIPSELGRAVGKAAGRSSLLQLALAPEGWGVVGHGDWGPVRLGLPDPRRDSTGLSAVFAAAGGGRPVTAGALGAGSTRQVMLGLSRAARTLAPDVPTLMHQLAATSTARELVTRVGLPVVPEVSLAAYDARSPAVPLVAAYPFGGAGAMTYPYLAVTGSWVGHTDRAAAADFGAWLRSDAVQGSLGRFGLRTAAGLLTPARRGLAAGSIRPVDAVADPAVLTAARGAWTAVSRPVSALALVDVSGSMSQPVPGTGKTKLELATAVATSSLVVFADSDRIGLRGFSTDLDGSTPWRELVALGPAAGSVDGTDRRTASSRAYAGMQALGGTALYNSVRDAVAAAQRDYMPGALNTVIVLTDGRNEDAPGSISLADLTASLATVAASVKPVHVITIGYGADVDQSALTAIAAASRGTSFAAPDPRDIDKVFVQALGALGR